MKKSIIVLSLIISLFFIGVNGEGILDNGKNLYSDYVYMVNLDTGKTVYEYEADTVTYPASLTKIMTCIIAIENCDNLDEVVTIPFGIFDDIYAVGGANINLRTGEEISLGDLIRATMIRSSCDTASAIAYHVSGSVEAFSKLMNEKAEQIGCTSTNFVNAHGLHDERHVTTAKDMFLIANYALQNEVFCDIISEYTCTIPATNKADERTLFTTMDLENPEKDIYCEYITGVKSGFTDEAGRCLITKAEKDGESYLLVTLGANRDKWYNSNMAFTDALTLFEYCFAEYGIKTVVSSSDALIDVPVSKGVKDSIALYIENDVVALTALDDTPIITYDIPDKITAPINAGDVVGKVCIDVGGETFTEKLVAKEAVEKKENKTGLQKLNDGNIVATVLDTASLVIFLVTIVIIALFVSNIKKHKKK